MRAEIDGRWTRIARLVGPQRIETGWHDANGARAAPELNGSGLIVPIRRDYWYAELSGGVALSIFRDINSGQWFLQGVLD